VIGIVPGPLSSSWPWRQRGEVDKGRLGGNITVAVTARLVESKGREHLKGVDGHGFEAVKEEKEREEMVVGGREVGGRRASPGAPSENLQRAPGWRNLSILL